MCNASSQDVKWFSVKFIVIEGIEAQIPLDVLCMDCGTGGEAYPLKYVGTAGRAQLVKDYHGSLELKKDFDLIRAGARLMQAKMRIEEVHSNTTCGMEVRIQVAVVPLDAFKNFFHQPAESVENCTIMDAYTPRNVWVRGAVLKKPIPAGLEHYDAVLFARVDRVLHKKLMTAGEILRDQQASERYTLACQQHQASLKLTPEASLSALTVTKVSEVCEIMQKNREEQERLRGANEKDAGNAAGRIMSHSRLDDEDGPSGSSTPVHGHPLATPNKRRRVGTAAPGTPITPSAIAAFNSRASARSSGAQGASSVVGAAVGGCVLKVEAGQSRRSAGRKDAVHATPGFVVDMMAILRGAALGHELKAHETKIKNNTFVNETDKEITIAEVATANACRGLWLKVLPKQPWPTIVQNVETLALNNVDMPLEHQQHITNRFAKMQLSYNDLDKMFSAMDASHSPGQAAWNVQTPRFGDCWESWEEALRTWTPDEKLPGAIEPEHQGFLWLDAFYGDPFMQLMNGKEQDKMLSYCMRVATFIETKMVCWPAPLQKNAMVALQIAKGFVALVSPVPFACGSKLSDVEYIAGMPGVAAAVATEFPKTGRLIANKLRRVGEVWPALIADYKKFMEPARNLGPLLSKASALATQLKSKSDWDQNDINAWDDVLTTTPDSLPVWRDDLRAGATQPFEQLLTDLIARDFDRLIASAGAEEDTPESLIEVAVDFQRALKECVIPEAGKLMQKMSNQVAEWARQAEFSNTMAAITRFVQSPSSDTLDSLARCLQDLPMKPDEVSAEMPRVAQDMIEWLSSSGAVCRYTSVVEILHMAPSPEWQTQLSIATELAAMEKVFDQPSVSLSKLGTAMEKVMQKLSTFSQAATSDPPLYIFLENANGAVSKAQTRYEAEALQACTGALVLVQKHTAQLSVLAGGAPNGGIWWQLGDNGDQPTPILEVYEKMLAPFDKEQAEKIVQLITKQRALCQTLLSTHNPRLPRLAAKLSCAPTILDEAKIQLDRAGLTKFERLICQSLQRGGKHLAERMTTFTAQVTALMEKPWNLVVAPGLVELVRAGLGAAGKASAP